MIKSILTLVFAILLTASAHADNLDVLFLGDNGHHQPRARFKQLQPVMSKRGIRLVYTDQMADLNADNLANYDALLVYANIDHIEPPQEKALLEYVAGGGGFVPLHCATYCFRNSDAIVASRAAARRAGSTRGLRPCRAQAASASSSTSTQCRTGVGVPVCRCWMQPMLALTMACGLPAAPGAPSLRSRSCVGQLGLQHAVGAGRAAAQVALAGGQLHLEAELAQAGLDAAAQLLAVLQGAGRVEGEPARRRAPCSRGLQRRHQVGQQLAQVARQLADARAPCRHRPGRAPAHGRSP